MKLLRHVLIVSLIGVLALASPAGAAGAWVEAVSLTAGGQFAPYALYSHVSDDGTKVAYLAGSEQPDTPPQLHVRTLATGATVALLGVGGEPVNAEADPIAISASGRYVLVLSSATNLPGTPAPAGVRHVYRWDVTNGVVKNVDTLANGTLPASYSTGYDLSPDGRFVVIASAVAFVADDTNGATDIYLVDLQPGTKTLVSKNLAGAQPGFGRSQLGTARVTKGGSQVFFAANAQAMGATTSGMSIYAWSAATGQVSLVTKRSNGVGYSVEGGDWDLSSDGRWLVALTDAALVTADTSTLNRDLYRVRTDTGAARLISIAEDFVHSALISPDGACLAFKENLRSKATLYYPGTRDYLRIPNGVDGLAPNTNNNTAAESISRGCSVVTLLSQSTNLVTSPEPLPAGNQAIYAWHAG
ncbi:MAG: hypothetical protein V9F00_10115 [Nocardioides sp.]